MFRLSAIALLLATADAFAPSAPALGIVAVSVAKDFSVVVM